MTTTNKTWGFVLTGINGFIAVVLGAFGAHGLKGSLDERLWSAYNTAVDYHFYHTLALMGCALAMYQLGWRGLKWAAVSFQLGIFLFSGSLYAMALGAPNWLGPITPIGGVFFMLGWILLAVTAVKHSRAL